MEVSAYSKNISISPRKVKDIADLVRRQTPTQAVQTLKFVRKKGAKPISDTLVSALANAKHNFGLGSEVLKIKKLEILKGPTMKRYRFAAHGRVRSILKRLTHIRIVLETEAQEKSKNIKEEVAKPEIVALSKPEAMAGEVAEKPKAKPKTKKEKGAR